MRLKIVVLLLVICLFTFIACKKDEDKFQGGSSDPVVEDTTDGSEGIPSGDEAIGSESKDSAIHLPKDEF